MEIQAFSFYLMYFFSVWCLTLFSNHVNFFIYFYCCSITIVPIHVNFLKLKKGKE